MTKWPPAHADLLYGRHASFALAMRDPARYKAYRPIKRAIRQRIETGKRLTRHRAPRRYSSLEAACIQAVRSPAAAGAR